MDVTLVDVGTGNLGSVHKALESLGARVTLTSDAEVCFRGSRVVLPGVGAFGDFMLGLCANGLDGAVREIVQRGDLLLGICVGMQALFEESAEMGTCRGLGLLPGKVVLFPPLPGAKIPHTGWNQLWLEMQSPLFRGFSGGEYVYFNHSYYCAASRAMDISVTTDFGAGGDAPSLRFPSAVQCDNLYGLQFHPEKSQAIGLRILENFLKLS